MLLTKRKKEVNYKSYKHLSWTKEVQCTLFFRWDAICNKIMYYSFCIIMHEHAAYEIIQIKEHCIYVTAVVFLNVNMHLGVNCIVRFYLVNVTDNKIYVCLANRTMVSFL